MSENLLTLFHKWSVELSLIKWQKMRVGKTLNDESLMNLMQNTVSSLLVTFFLLWIFYELLFNLVSVLSL